MRIKPSRAVRAEHYRSKAEEVRIIAESMKNAENKDFMMNVAADYLMLANLMELMDDPLPAGEDFNL